MQPALSLIFLTILIGTGQGLFLALYANQIWSWLGFLDTPVSAMLQVLGSIVALLLLLAGLIASFFHLGHPERAWRAATRWRSSWLSREVIVLPLVILSVILYGLTWYPDSSPQSSASTSTLSLTLGTIGALLSITLFICTGMIYAGIRFLQEWSNALTIVNFTLLGAASGFTLAAVLATNNNVAHLQFFTLTAITVTLLGLITRGASLWHNRTLQHKSTPQTAIGIRHKRIFQLAQGAIGGSFNTREFFHGRNRIFMQRSRWLFIILTFVLPIILMLLALNTAGKSLLISAAICQFLGLFIERWYFFADAHHPQNLYYQNA
ncbi:MAG TPA: DMSO reductase [Gammaproteobacteria bacterium]|nr:DMSO reductase [Gammaproteobacteria bacterium]